MRAAAGWALVGLLLSCGEGTNARGGSGGGGGSGGTGGGIASGGGAASIGGAAVDGGSGNVGGGATSCMTIANVAAGSKQDDGDYIENDPEPGFAAEDAFVYVPGTGELDVQWYYPIGMFPRCRTRR
jgi:hypothetical protein